MLKNPSKLTVHFLNRVAVRFVCVRRAFKRAQIVAFPVHFNTSDPQAARFDKRDALIAASVIFLLSSVC